MAKEGAWINAKTGQYWWVQEHCSFAKSQAGADAMGLPTHVREAIAPLPCDFNGEGRAGVVILVMKAGFIRFRGHGIVLTCEFWGDTYTNLWASFEFLQKMCGPFSHCTINNIKTNESISLRFDELSQRMKEDAEGVMRIAKAMVASVQHPVARLHQLADNPDLSPSR